jgi:DNA topoisomerase-3
VLGALARASQVRIVSDEFVKDGETIVFQRVYLESAGRSLSGPRGGIRMVVVPERATAKGGARTKRTKSGSGRTRAARRDGASKAARGGGRTGRERASPDTPPLEAALRAWRTTEAKKRRVPAFRILTDRTLIGIVHARPKDESDLLDVSGIGPALLEKYGRALPSIVAEPR